MKYYELYKVILNNMKIFIIIFMKIELYDELKKGKFIDIGIFEVELLLLVFKLLLFVVELNG